MSTFRSQKVKGTSIIISGANSTLTVVELDCKEVTLRVASFRGTHRQCYVGVITFILHAACKERYTPGKEM